MIITELWNGQGLGNQLHCYVTTRCIALQNGYEFGIHHPERFKGASFLSLDFGKNVIGGKTSIEGQPPEELPDTINNYYVEKTILHTNGSNISGYDDNLFKIPDNTKIDGLMQGELYYRKYKESIKEWFNITKLDLPEDLCIINFRGGDYRFEHRFFLVKSYWDNAIKNMLKVNPNMSFRVVTDDVYTATPFFQEYGFPITHEIKNDFESIHSASYLILSNSSFAFFPAWLSSSLKFCIAPRYWGRHNISDGYWSIDQNYTEGWYYQDRDGNLHTRKDI